MKRGVKLGWGQLCCASVALLASAGVSTAPQAPAARPAQAVPATPNPIAAVSSHADTAVPSQQFLDKYCITCHNERTKTGGLALDTLDVTNVGADAAEWEKAVVKLRAGLMPPTGMPRPEPAVMNAFTVSLESALDRAAAANPNPGRTEPFHRLNRAEYENAIRDLLALDVDASNWLPTDEISYGFDNIAGVLKLSPLLTERYLNTAQKIARLALGTPAPANGDMYRVPDQLDQDIRLEGMPVGTRGGHRVDYHAPRDGDYDIKVRIGRGIDYDIPHYIGDQQLEVSVDGEPVKVFVLPATPGVMLNFERQASQGVTPGPAPRRGDQPSDAPPKYEQAPRDIDNDWVVRVPLTAGVHEVRATFLMKTNAVSEGFRRPFLKPYIGRGTDDERETREGAALRELEIMGPINPGAAATSASYKRVFVCRPASATGSGAAGAEATREETACATRILSTLAKRAYRRPVTDADMTVLLDFYQKGRTGGTFDTGIELALQRILVSPSFLFRTEFDPPSLSGSGAAGPAAAPAAQNGARSYRISDLSLASRLSFFLWSSIPDDELLDLATKNTLHEPAVLARQVKRMLADPRSHAFTENFAGQWLSLRRLVDIVPDPFLFPDYGDTLALAFRREVELFFDSIVREDRPVMDLLTADYTFANERLATHYGIPNVKGIAFRRVALPEDSPRRGLLGKGAVLTVTAFPNRTSPVVRGKWVLQNILGAPPPEPPPDVPGLEENGEKVTKVRTLRERLELHRASATCASCHKLMDPIGFALENFDAVGKYRTVDENYEPLDNSGVYADGSRIDGVAGLRQVLVKHSDQFLANVTKTLLTYALGRGVEYYDAPTVRAILREAGPAQHRFSSIVLGIVKSAPFQMRRSDS
jgi:mono/diheme cytochrome c family protein